MTNKEFVERVFEEVRICGWDVDATESWNFASWLAGKYNVEVPEGERVYKCIYAPEKKEETTVGYLKDNIIYSYETDEIVGSFENGIFNNLEKKQVDWKIL